MHMWRFTVITFLREALKSGMLASKLHPGKLKAVLAREYRWWSTHVDYFQSKEHFLRYAGRYARRPPIALHRFEEVTNYEHQNNTGARPNQQLDQLGIILNLFFSIR